MELQRPEVREEYEKFQRKRASIQSDNDWVVWFNNFSLNLPEGSMRKYDESSGGLDKKIVDLDDPNIEYYRKKSSELRFSQTNREFYETVDRVLMEEGVFEAVRAENAPKRFVCTDLKNYII